MKHLLYYYTFLLFLLSSDVRTRAIQCKDENNEDTDWFVVYKIPKVRHFNQLIEDGVAYAYVTSTNLQSTLSKISINSSRSIIGNTLEPLYQDVEKTDISYVLYNDQPSNEPKKNNKGHTKGVILVDINGGFWLIHSVPLFPKLSQIYSFSENGVTKGQSFLCISLDLKNLNKIGRQLQYNEPQIYSDRISKILQTKLGEIVKVVSGQVITEPPWYNKMIVTSINGVKFSSFAKSGKFGKDLYEDWVAPDLGNDLMTETWLNGAGRLPSNCSKTFKVFNIESVLLEKIDISFKDSQDHSKWAVTTNLSWICIGDINRMQHQKARGGGTVCLNNPTLADVYRNSIKSIEKCQKSN